MSICAFNEAFPQVFNTLEDPATTNSEIVALFNEAAAQLLAFVRVERFADRKSAIRRTIAIYQALAADPEAVKRWAAKRLLNAKVDPGTAQSIKDFAAAKVVQAASDAPALETTSHKSQGETWENVVTVEVPNLPGMSEGVVIRDGQAITVTPAPAKTIHKPTPAVTKAVKSAIESAAAKAGTTPRYLRSKAVAASKVGYLPKGAKQVRMYELLTTREPESGRIVGVTLEEFVQAMNDFNGNTDRGMWRVSEVWGPVSFLFATQKGYGLTFDGSRIALVIPASERTAKKEA